MSDRHDVVIVIPGDDPPQIQGSPHLERLRRHGEVRLHTDRPATPEEKIARARDAVCLVNTRGAIKWPREALLALPRLRMATVCGIGTDAFDLVAARERGIVVCNIPGKTAPIVAEHAFGLMLAAAKRAHFQTAELKAGRWTSMDNVYLHGKTLGVVGTGAIGGAMARLGRAIGMDVVAWTFSPTPARAAELGVRYLPLDELLRTADVVSVHVRLTAESRGLLGSRELGLMKPGAILVNTARGPVVDTDRAGGRPRCRPPGRGGARRVRHRAAPAGTSPARLPAGRADPAQRRSDARGHGPPERGRRRQRDRVPGGTAPERRRVARLLASAIPVRAETREPADTPRAGAPASSAPST